MFDMIENPRTIKVYSYLSDTKEYIGPSDAYIAPWTGLPANSTDIAPSSEAPDGFVLVWNSLANNWTILEDNRKTTIYRVTDASPLYVELLGPIPDGYTTLVPGVEYPTWNGNSWVSDDSKKLKVEMDNNKKLKEDLMDEASQCIDTLLDATDPDIMGDDINPDDVTLLKIWKQYRVLLSRVDINNPNWPNLPSA
ncbi:tail fiber assembly protein Tfa [Yersinia phage vB_YenM_P744]